MQGVINKAWSYLLFSFDKVSKGNREGETEGKGALWRRGEREKAEDKESVVGKNQLSYYRMTPLLTMIPLKCKATLHSDERKARRSFCSHGMQMFPFSTSIGLAAPHPLTERRRRRVGKNTSETGERVRVIRDTSAQETDSDILKGLSTATLTVTDVEE